MKKGIRLIALLGTIILLVIIMILVTGHSHRHFLKQAYPIAYQEYVSAAAEKYDVEPALIYAVIKTESDFNPIAQSRAGALGLMQIMPNTFDWLKSKTDEEIDVSALEDPEINIRYGTFLLSILLERYQIEGVAICAYNAGIGTVDRWLSDSELSEDQQSLLRVPYPETDQYLERVLESRGMYRSLYFQ